MIQIAKTVFLNNVAGMKQILDLLEFKLGKKSPEFSYMKKQVMNSVYQNLKKTFKTLADEKILVRCKCKSNGRKGYSDCLCGGSGFVNK